MASLYPSLSPSKHNCKPKGIQAAQLGSVVGEVNLGGNTAKQRICGVSMLVGDLEGVSSGRLLSKEGRQNKDLGSSVRSGVVGSNG